MKNIFTLSIFFVFLSLVRLQAQEETYSRVKINTGETGIGRILQLGIPLDNSEFVKGAYLLCELSQAEIGKIASAGFEYEVLIEDMAMYYQERNAGMLTEGRLKELKALQAESWPVPEGFELGTVGGFCSIDQMLAHLDTMAARYPDLVSPRYAMDSLTHNGKAIYWVRLSDNPTVNEDEPEVLYTGMHHAREPIGMQLLLYYMYYLLENYGTDEEATYLLDNFELYFVPVINMDGYAYNIQFYPNGGGQWRKNRRNNGDGSFGVDLNRNYGYQWGYDNSGSSPYTDDATYRGPYAFSEPCTQNMRDFCETNEFRIALNYHSYSNLLLYPWGFSPDPCADDAIFDRYGSILTTENGYTYGPGYTTIYVTNGSSDDWMYGEQQSKDLILAYTPEVGNGGDGFWPSVSRIIPLCQENMYQNIMAAKLAGAYATVKDLSPSIINVTSGVFEYEIERVGLAENGIYTVSITPLNASLSVVGDPDVYDDLALLEVRNGSIEYTLSSSIQEGDEILFLLSVDNGMITTSDTISKIFGTPVVVFEDDASTMDNWSSSKWNTTTFQYNSPGRSITDSPFGDYLDDEYNYITLTGSLDLTQAAYASLSFWAKWFIEAGYDYVQVLASKNNGSTWIPLSGKYTKTGNSYQATGQPVYDGFQFNWVQEEMDLGDFIGYEVKLRFLLVSDGGVTEDGFYWDDLALTVVDLATGMADRKTISSAGIHGPYPNPVADEMVFYPDGLTGVGELTLEIFSITGQKMFSENVASHDGEIRITASGLHKGLYFFRFVSAGKLVGSGKFIVNR